MSYPIDDIKPGDCIYSEGIESDVVIQDIIKRDDQYILVTIAGYTDYQCQYELSYCHSSLAYGPHWLIEPMDYKLPCGTSMDDYWKITDKIHEISQYD